MKKYIFVTHSIKNVGGVQCYLAAKTKYLEDNGWDVFVFFSAPRPKKYNCPIKYLEKFLPGNFLWIGLPPYKIPRWVVSRTLSRILSKIGEVDKNEENIVETHNDIYAEWGELIASRIGARHYTYLMNEYFRSPGQTYIEKMEFFLYKFKRHEILGGLKSFTRLFDGYLVVNSNDYPGEVLIDECPIQDVANDKVYSLKKKDWNICYIGRENKPYVPYIIYDVAKFSSMHKDKIVQFIIVGEIKLYKELISKLLAENTNLCVVELGFLHPIPLALYSKIDVVVAGSGSARHSCEAGAITIVADPETNCSNGILGYETMNSVYLDDDSVVSDFYDALERVLVEKVHLKMENKYPPKLGVDFYVKQNFDLFSQSERKIGYYTEKSLLDGAVNYRSMLTTWFVNNFPAFTEKIISLVYFVSSRKNNKNVGCQF